MAGIVVAAYQPGLMGWPRFILLVVGSLFLLALTIEVIKKRVHMYVISDVLKELQGPNGLRLDDDFRFPVGLSEDVENYWNDKRTRHKIEEVHEPTGDWLYNSLRGRLARRWLAYVTFFAFVAVAILALFVLVELIIGFALDSGS